jgi:hypothetical protein
MLTVKQLNRKVAGIRKSTSTIRDNVQVVLCNASGHAFEHGDVTVFTKLYEASTGLNKKKIVKWVHDNGFARLQADGTFKVNRAMRKSADFDNGEQVVKYLTNEVDKWYTKDETAEQILKELDVVARIQSLVKQIDTAVEKGQVIKSEDADIALRVLNAKIESIAA